jgi:NAD(P)-dependent dehydrogenase (short-subunit alcohol dehydrogenase family)
VVAAVRSPDAALDRLRSATGTASDADDRRLVAVRLDLDDPESIAAAAKGIDAAVGAPYGVVHNAGIAGVGAVEEMPMDVWAQIFSTNLFGPVRLTQALLPAMRAAGRGRIVVVSSQGAMRGMPTISAYSAAKGALERWAEALSHEVTGFGIGVSILVAGTFRTDILELTPTWRDPAGPYATHHDQLERVGGLIERIAAAPDRFAPAVARALTDRGPLTRRSVGLDAKLLAIGNRLIPTRLLQRLVGSAMRLPSPGSLTDDPARHLPVTPRDDDGEPSG